jgi:signal transduction histidine kinase
MRHRHSIKGRLLGLFVLLALATTAVFLFGTQRLLRGGWSSYVRPMVSDYADRLAAEIGTPPSAERARALAARLPITVRIDGPLVQYDSAPHHDEHYEADGEAAEAWGLVRRTADGHRIRFGLARAPDPTRPRVTGLLTLATLLLLTVLAWAGVRRQLAPLQAIGAGVQAYGRGDFSQKIPVRRPDELGLLAERINGMAANLSGMLEAKRALLLAISHELRSPLTRARVNAELVDDGTPKTALLRDLAEMRDLITSLLESERLAQGHAALQAEPCDLAALARDAAAAQTAPVTLRLDEAVGRVQADPTRLRLLLRNLLANALRHSPPGAPPPVLFLQREADGRIALGVRDHGPGVAPEVITQLGQAFWRPDSARTREAGGVGLGLYLSRLVAQAHGGELRIRRSEPGLEVSAVWMPQRV